MVNNIVPGAITSLSRPPAGWFDYGYAVLWNGELALLRTDFDIHAALARWYEVTRQSCAEERPDLSGARLKLSVFDGAKESADIEVPVGRWAIADRLLDGWWLVVSDPLDPASNINARLYMADGAPAGAFAIGNYVTRVQCGGRQHHWAGYFDASLLKGDTTISSAGIALTLDSTTLWSCFEPDFSIVRIAQGVVRSWRNEIAGADARASDGEHVLVVGAIGGHRSQLALLRLDNDKAREVGTWKFRRPDRNAARLLQGRGVTLHVVDSGKWRKITVASLLEGRVYN